MLSHQSNKELNWEFKPIKIPGSPINKININRKNFIKLIFIKINRKVKYLIFKTDIYWKLLKIKYPINTPGSLIWVNPKMINYMVINNKYENTFADLSGVEGGNWDKNILNINTLNIFQALYDLIINHIPLKNTKFYNPKIKNQSDIAKEGMCRSWEYISEYEYESRSKKIESLINNIISNGYRSQFELDGLPNDEVIVKIDRDGKILFFNSIHRMCIAKILGLQKIPVIVKTRHIKWYNFKNELLNFAKNQRIGTNHEGQIYQKLSHPDLQDIPYTHENDDRFDAIDKNRITHSGNLLDIGANLGFFSSRFEDIGYNCTAVETDPQLVYFMEKIKKAEEKSFKIVHDNILEIYNKPIQFDVVLALNIFHHFIKTESNYIKFKRLLHNLKIKEMFFEPHNPEEFYAIKTYINFNNEQFIKIIMENTGLRYCEKILDCYEGRKLYHLWSDL